MSAFLNLFGKARDMDLVRQEGRCLAGREAVQMNGRTLNVVARSPQSWRRRDASLEYIPPLPFAVHETETAPALGM